MKKKTKKVLGTIGVSGMLIGAMLLMPKFPELKAKDNFTSDYFTFGEAPKSESLAVERKALTGKEEKWERL